MINRNINYEGNMIAVIERLKYQVHCCIVYQARVCQCEAGMYAHEGLEYNHAMKS